MPSGRGIIRNTTKPKITTPNDMVGEVSVVRDNQVTVRMQTGVVKHLRLVRKTL